MSLSDSTSRSFSYIEGPPERIFRLAPLELEDDAVVSSMQSGPWNIGPSGESSAGSMSVLIDVVLGYLPAVIRPEGQWPVTTTIHVDFIAPVPTGGSVITARGELVCVDSRSALCRGEVRDHHDQLVAIATERLHFISGMPPAAEEANHQPWLPQVPAELSPTAQLLEVLGGTIHHRRDRTVLEIPLGPEVTNPLNMMHGGIALCGMEVAAESALRRAGSRLPISSITASYLAPGPVTGAAAFEASVTHRSRSLGQAEVVMQNSLGRICTRAVVMAQSR